MSFVWVWPSEFNQGYLNEYGWEITSWSVGYLSVATPLKTVTASPQAAINCQRPSCILPPVLYSFSQSFGHTEFMSTVTRRQLCGAHPHPILRLLHSFCPQFHSVPWALDGVTYVSHFWAKHSSPHSLPFIKHSACTRSP